MGCDECRAADAEKDVAHKRQGKIRPHGRPDLIPEQIADNNVNDQRSHHGPPDNPHDEKFVLNRSFPRCVHQDASMFAPSEDLITVFLKGPFQLQ
jgi:hypothetical protein